MNMTAKGSLSHRKPVGRQAGAPDLQSEQLVCFPSRGKPAGSQRGAVMAEAVIVLPVLVLVFFGVTFVHSLYAARHQAKLQARSCAWQTSASACKHKACDTATDSEDVGFGAGQNALSSKASELTEPIQGSGQSHGEDALLQDKANDTVQSEISGLIGKGVDSNAQVSVPRPFYLGGGEAVVGASYHLPCNIEPKTPVEVIGDLWNKINPF
jgi:hypothetical protein